MKKIIFTLVLLVVTAISPDLYAAIPKNDIGSKATSIAESIKKDSLTIVALRDSISKMVNDTIVNFDRSTQSADDNAGTPTGAFSFQYENDDEPLYEFAVAVVGITVPFFTIFLIVVACLIISYKKRKSRYALIEKAIASNYQIPEYLINETKTSLKAEASTEGEYTYMPMQWSGLRNGIIMVAVGLGLLIAFWSSGFMMGICAMVIFIGLAKMGINWLENQNLQKYYAAQAKKKATESDSKDSGSVPPPVPPTANNSNN